MPLMRLTCWSMKQSPTPTSHPFSLPIGHSWTLKDGYWLAQRIVLYNNHRPRFDSQNLKLRQMDLIRNPTCSLKLRWHIVSSWGFKGLIPKPCPVSWMSLFKPLFCMNCWNHSHLPSWEAELLMQTLSIGMEHKQVDGKCLNDHVIWVTTGCDEIPSLSQGPCSRATCIFQMQPLYSPKDEPESWPAIPCSLGHMTCFRRIWIIVNQH